MTAAAAQTRRDDRNLQPISGLRFNSDGKVVTGVYIKYVDVKPHRVLSYRSPEGYYIHTEE